MLMIPEKVGQTPEELTRREMLDWLRTSDEDKLRGLYERARRIKREHVGPKIYLRGLIEFSNVCAKDCYYCGIRRSNRLLVRYQISEKEILDAARFALEAGYGSVCLQAGERTDAAFVDFVEKIIRRIKNFSHGSLGITLSLGEQSIETYERWFEAGAHRYLLRIETSNPDLYRRLHPEDHSHDRRLQCLDDLKHLGYQVGTGVMIGLPGQTAEDLADDLEFFKTREIDMIGMGPYLVHHDTPLAAGMPEFDPGRQLRLGLTMIALTRLYLKDVNIVAATALQALDPLGRKSGLKAGANIFMPNITPKEYRAYYRLYENKPCTDEAAGQCRHCLESVMIPEGDIIGYNEWGDSLHFFHRKQRNRKMHNPAIRVSPAGISC